MGLSLRCYIGFPTFRNSPAGEALECQGAQMARCYRSASSQMLRGYELLHDAIDAAVQLDRKGMAASGKRALGRLDRAAAELSELVATVKDARIALEKLFAESDDDPLVRREPFFRQLDATRLGAALTQRSGSAVDKLWLEMSSTLAMGGALAGLRLLEKTAWRFHTALREHLLAVRQSLAAEPREAARRLHESGLDAAVLADLSSSFLRQTTYLGLLCEEATRLWELEVDREEARTA